MATEKKDEFVFTPGYVSADRKGVWFQSKAQYPLDDPTPVQEGKGAPVRFEPQSFTQATVTPWVLTQWKAGNLTRFTGDPRDEDTKVVPVPEEPKADVVVAVAPAAAPAATGTVLSADEQELVDQMRADKKVAADKKAADDKLAAEKAGAKK